MPEVKHLLGELQSTDLELHEFRAQREAIPKKVAELQAEIQGLKQGYEDLKTRTRNYKKELKLAELNLSSKEEDIARYNSQLYSAKTNEEYKAFLKEIETAQHKKAEIEDEMINLMEEIEKGEAQIAERQDKYQDEIDEKEEEIAKVEGNQGELEEKIAVLEDKRERLVRELPEDVMAIYERIQKNKGTLAVAHILEGNRCSGCLNPVPTQKAIEAGHTNRLFFCEYCGRILIG